MSLATLDPTLCLGFFFATAADFADFVAVDAFNALFSITAEAASYVDGAASFFFFFHAPRRRRPC